MIRVFCGSNWQALKPDLDACIAAFVAEHGDIALERIDCGEAEVHEVLRSLESMPFLATKKMVVLQDMSKNPGLIEQLDKVLERADETTELVIVEGKLDKRSVYYKSLSKLPGFSAYEDLNEQTAAKWAVSYAQTQGATISTNDAHYLVERVGTDQSTLAREIEKLALYNGAIDRTSIELLASETPTSTIFNLVDAAFNGDTKKALRLYDEQRAQKVEPQSIHGMLVWQMHVVAVCSAGGNMSATEIAAQTGMKPFVVQKAYAIAQRMGKQGIADFLTLLRDIDYTSKRQAYDYDEALKHAIVVLAAS